MSDIGHECDTRGEEDMQPRRKPRDEGDADDQAEAQRKADFEAMSFDDHVWGAMYTMETVYRELSLDIAGDLDLAIEHIKAAQAKGK